jgi:ABC-type branched-subunit amino acid transport system substrate-binding protein
MATKLADYTGGRSFVVILGDDHDSRSLMSQLQLSFRQHNITPAFQFVDDARAETTQEIVRRTLEALPVAAVVIADPETSARVIRSLRGAGYAGQVFGGPSIGRRRFLREAAADADGVLFPILVDQDFDKKRFTELFHNQFHRRPDFAAGHSYDATRLLVNAIRRAGLNRVRIADALRELSPWEGVCGTVQWDALGGNSRSARVGTVESYWSEEVTAQD